MEKVEALKKYIFFLHGFIEKGRGLQYTVIISVIMKWLRGLQNQLIQAEFIVSGMMIGAIKG